MVKNKYTIIRDTREQDGWDFNSEENGVKMLCKKLNTGDYSIEGYEDILCIERKATPSEVATNIGKDKIRFNKEIDRMRDFTHAFIICEFSFNDMIIYPEGSRLTRFQKSKIKIKGPYILKALTEYQVEYNIQIIYAGSPQGGKIAAESIFKRILNVR
jgi:ERCC4-type nuclease